MAGSDGGEKDKEMASTLRKPEGRSYPVTGPPSLHLHPQKS